MLPSTNSLYMRVVLESQVAVLFFTNSVRILVAVE